MAGGLSQLRHFPSMPNPISTKDRVSRRGAPRGQPAVRANESQRWPVTRKSVGAFNRLAYALTKGHRGVNAMTERPASSPTRWRGRRAPCRGWLVCARKFGGPGPAPASTKAISPPGLGLNAGQLDEIGGAAANEKAGQGSGPKRKLRGDFERPWPALGSARSRTRNTKKSARAWDPCGARGAFIGLISWLNWSRKTPDTVFFLDRENRPGPLTMGDQACRMNGPSATKLPPTPLDIMERQIRIRPNGNGRSIGRSDSDGREAPGRAVRLRLYFLLVSTKSAPCQLTLHLHLEKCRRAARLCSTSCWGLAKWGRL